jgi:serine-type D-Ala-D-Ala carboxypeptidase
VQNILKEKIENLINKKIDEKVISAFSIVVNKKGSEVLKLNLGKTSFKEDAKNINENSIYDIASLTKVFSTSFLFLNLLDQNPSLLEIKIKDIFSKYSISFNKELESIKIKDLLSHSSGLKAYMPMYEFLKSRSDIYMFVRSRHLQYKTRSKNIYSDLGYILLGEILEIIHEKKLDTLFNQKIALPLNLKNTFYLNEDLKNKEFVSSGYSNFRNIDLEGKVNDENTAVMNNVSGHCGLFSTIEETSKMVFYIKEVFKDKQKENIFNKSSLIKAFKKQSTEWNYMGLHIPTKNSSAGRFISKNSLGMTGFTGCSFWIDFDKDIVITILSNRTISKNAAKIGGEKDDFTNLRSMIHDIVLGDK